VEKGVIASFRNVDPCSRAIKVRSTRSTRLCAYTCKTVTEYLLLLLPSNSCKQNLQGLDVTIAKKIRIKLIKAYLLYKVLKKKKKKKTCPRRVWMGPIFTEERKYEQGTSNNLIIEMKNVDPKKFILRNLSNICEWTDSFNELLKLIEPNITKQKILLEFQYQFFNRRYLLHFASGNTMHFVSFAFWVATNKVSKFVAEIYQTIWNGLKDIVFPECTKDMWIQKTKEFSNIWNFPSCIGEIGVLVKLMEHIGLQVYIYLYYVFQKIFSFILFYLYCRLYHVVVQHFIITKMYIALYLWHLQISIIVLQWYWWWRKTKWWWYIPAKWTWISVGT